MYPGKRADQAIGHARSGPATIPHVGYRLGVDLGTTYTAAALNIDGHAEMLSLGNRATQIASVLYIKPDGQVLVGEPAELRGAAEPTRLVREFKRRIGDSVPLIVGGAPHSPQSLLARVLSWVVDVASKQQGEAPEHVCVTYPANWGPFKHEILEQVIKLAGLRGASTCTEPEAAAIAYASRDRVPDGARLAVYDLGGGTFDAAVLLREGPGFRLAGAPNGVEHLGGIDFDTAICQHVMTSLGEAVEQLDDTDPATLLGITRLRRDCVSAKEALSSDTDTVIPVALPGISTSVHFTRAEFEEMVRPAIAETVSAMRRALDSAGVAPAELTAIILVGGSSRIPLVAKDLTAAFGRPIAMDNQPKHDVALGAAIRATSAAQSQAARVAPAPSVVAWPGGPPMATAGARSFHPPPFVAPPYGAQPYEARPHGAQVYGSPTYGAQQQVSQPRAVRTSAPQQASPQPPARPPSRPPSQQRPGSPPQPSAPPVQRPQPPPRWEGGPPPRPMQGAAGWPGGEAGYRPPSDPTRARPPEWDPEPGSRWARRWVAVGAIGVVVVLVIVIGIVLIPRAGGSEPNPTTTATPDAESALPMSPQPLPDDVIIWPRHQGGGNWDITTVTAAGVTGQSLISSPEEDNLPLVSADRRTVLYLHRRSPSAREVRVMGADGSGDRPLFGTVPRGCSDVTRPAFGGRPVPQLVLPCVDPATGDTTLNLVSLDGTVIRVLDRGWLSDPAMTADGTAAVYWRDNETRGEGGAIWRATLDGSVPPSPITPGTTPRDNDPAVSPNGELVAITRAGQGIWTVALGAGNTLTQLTKEPTDQDPSWSPDGSRIAFKRQDELWVMNADGGDPHRISQPGEVGTAAAWTPR